MSKKLYYVEITKSGWVLADDEHEAERFKNDILMNEDLYDIQVSEYDEKLLKSSGWEPDCCLYHKDQRHKDITLREALQND